MSSFRRRFAVRVFRLSYLVPIFGDIYRFGWEAWNRSRAIDVYMRDMSPRERRLSRAIMLMTGEFWGSFDPRPEKRTLH